MKYSPSHRARVPRVAMGGLLDLNPTATRHDPEIFDQKCFDDANRVVANMDKAHDDLVLRWHPSGIYTIQQLDAIIKSVFAMIVNAANTVTKALMEEALAQGDRDALQMVLTNVRIKMGVDGMKFLNASRDAKAKGITLIDAPGLKRWITASMRDASQCIFAVHYILCKRPWFVGALQGFMVVFNAAYSVARATVGVAVDVAKAAGSAILFVPDALSTAIKAAKWGVIGGIAYLLYKGEHKKLLAKF